MNPDVFGWFSIFSHFLNFGWFCEVSQWNSARRLNFLPGDALRSAWDWIFTQNTNFVRDVTARNKKYQKYQPWPCNGFIIPPSSRALPLHALIIALKPSGKIVKLQNELASFSHDEEFESKIFKSSFNFDLKTSCALPPYYSLELAQ